MHRGQYGDSKVKSQTSRSLLTSSTVLAKGCCGQTYRGQYGGGEDERLAVLGLAMDLGAPYVDVELKAAPAFSASRGANLPQCTILIHCQQS